MKIDEYKLIKYRGKVVANIKQNKKIQSKFLIDFRLNTKRYRNVIQVVDDGSNANMIQRAIKERDNLIEQKDNSVDSQVSNMTLNQYFIRHITSRSKANKWSSKYLEDTKRAYALYIENLIGKRKVTAIRSTHITDVMDGVAHLSLRSQKLVIEVLKPLFNKALFDDNIITKSPIQISHHVKRNAKEEKKLISNAVDKYKLVYTKIHEIFDNDPKNRALLLFGFYGRRKTETLMLRWEDVNLQTSQYIVRAENSKAKVGMTFTLASDLKVALIELKKTSNDGFVFISPIQQGQRLKKVDGPILKLRIATELPELTYHWFRNLSVSALSSMGVESIHLSSMLGHTDVNTVNKYLSLQREASSAHTLDFSAKLLGTNNDS